jgi:hypothetical protein
MKHFDSGFEGDHVHACEDTLATGQILVRRALSGSTFASKVGLRVALGSSFGVVNAAKCPVEALLCLVLFRDGIPFMPVDEDTPAQAVRFRLTSFGFVCTLFVSPKLLVSRSLVGFFVVALEGSLVESTRFVVFLSACLSLNRGSEWMQLYASVKAISFMLSTRAVRPENRKL